MEKLKELYNKSCILVDGEVKIKWEDFVEEVKEDYKDSSKNIEDCIWGVIGEMGWELDGDKIEEFEILMESYS